MSLIPFPNVPLAPGVPPLPRLLGAAVSTVLQLLDADDPGVFGLVQDAQWGVFDDGGAPVALADSVVAFEHDKEFRVSDFPLEGGEFASYNKVEMPYDERVTFAKGGTEGDRASFLDAVHAAVGSLHLFTVVTPELTYVDANLVHYSYRRQARGGVTLLLVDIHIREVRATASGLFTKTQNPAGAAQVSGGTVQAQKPSLAQAAAAAGGAS